MSYPIVSKKVSASTITAFKYLANFNDFSIFSDIIRYMNNIFENLKHNSHIPQRCITTAEISDEKFQTIAKSNKLLIEKSSDSDDIHNHIDYYVTLNNFRFPVDIKSAKKFMESNYTNLLDEWIWVELKNVNGKSGWLYGKSVYIVYVFIDQLWFINRNKFISFIKNKVTPITVLNKQDSKYKLYARHDRKDLITQVNLGDIKNTINPAIIKNR